MSKKFPSPPADRQCQAFTHLGTRCGNWATGLNEDGKLVCVSHGGPGQSLVQRDPSQAQALRNRRRAEKAEEERLRTLSMRDQIRARAELHREALVSKLLEHALSEDPRVSLPALQVVMDRIFGKPLAGVVNVHGALSPAQAEELKSTIQSLSSEERLAIARERIGLSRPSHPTLEAEVVEVES